MVRLKLLSHNRVKSVEHKGKRKCQECSTSTRVTRLQNTSAPTTSSGRNLRQTGEAARRAVERVQAEAKRSRHALAALLVQLRKPLASSCLWPTTRLAAALCSGSFEKSYLTKLSGRICGSPTHATALSGIAAELFMFAALTVDDWLDGTTFRAGKPAIHSTHGSEETVLAANCLTEAAHLALNEAAAALPSKLRAAFLESFRTAGLSIQAGQADVLALSGKPVDSIAVVERLARLRCGKLIASVMTAGAYLSERVELLPALAEAGEWLGIALQYRNDIQDFTVAFDETVKPPLADLLNGQPNLVVCLLFQTLPRMKPRERGFLKAMHARYRSKTGKVLGKGEFSSVLDLVSQYGASAEAMDQLAACVRRSRQSLVDRMPHHVMEEFEDYLELMLHP